MKGLTLFSALIAAAAGFAGCATLSYEGMPPKDAPHAMAIEEKGINFVSVDGRSIRRPAFSRAKLRLAPGPHEILAQFEAWERDTDYAGDVTIDITIHYWSPFAQVIAFDAREGVRFYIGAEANLPRTEINYDIRRRYLDLDENDSIDITVEHELTSPDDWRPIITRTLPIKNYWNRHPLPVAAVKGREVTASD